VSSPRRFSSVTWPKSRVFSLAAINKNQNLFSVIFSVLCFLFWLFCTHFCVAHFNRKIANSCHRRLLRQLRALAALLAFYDDFRQRAQITLITSSSLWCRLCCGVKCFLCLPGQHRKWNTTGERLLLTHLLGLHTKCTQAAKVESAKCHKRAMHLYALWKK